MRKTQILLNNLAYALVNLGKVEEAHALLPRIRPGGSAVVEILHAATSGLIHYRMGDRVRGRAETDAIRRLKRARLFNLRAKSEHFLCPRGILRAGSVDAVQAKEVAVAFSRPFADADIFIFSAGSGESRCSLQRARSLVATAKMVHGNRSAPTQPYPT